MSDDSLSFFSGKQKAIIVLILAVCFLAACTCIDTWQPVPKSETRAPTISSIPFPTDNQGTVDMKSTKNISEDIRTYTSRHKETTVPERPWLTIDTVGRFSHGDTIPIHGLTNIASGNKLQVMVYPASVDDVHKPQEFMSRYSSMREIPVFSNISAPYTWSLELDTTTLVPDEYIVRVEGIVDVEGVVQLVTTTQRFRIYGDAMNMNAEQSIVAREGDFWTNDRWNLTVLEIDARVSQPKAKMWIRYHANRLGGIYVTPGYSDLWYSGTPHDENTPRLGIIVSHIGNDSRGMYVRYTVSWNTTLNHGAE